MELLKTLWPWLVFVAAIVVTVVAAGHAITNKRDVRAAILVGSSNWDPRSLRLNFEYNLECYDAALARQLLALTDDKMRRGRRLTLEEVDGRSLPVRLRDGVARLFLPYL